MKLNHRGPWGLGPSFCRESIFTIPRLLNIAKQDMLTTRIYKPNAGTFGNVWKLLCIPLMIISEDHDRVSQGFLQYQAILVSKSKELNMRPIEKSTPSPRPKCFSTK